MFDDIEREYKKGLREKRFASYYWPRVVTIVAVAVMLDLIIGRHRWLIYGCVIAIIAVVVTIFFLKEYRHAHKTSKSVRQSKGILAKFITYYKIDDAKRIDKLALDFAHHNLRTKSDIKLALDYFQSRLPVNATPRLLDWVFTTAIALTSIIILTYDNSINALDLQKFIAIATPSVMVALVILTPFIIAKLIYRGISRSRSRIDAILVQDLAYIYVNFEKYQKQVETKNPSQS